MNEPLLIELEIDEGEELEFDDLELDEEVPMSFGTYTGGGVKDYRYLANKPSINGTELYDNYNEIDPTVPDWAKTEFKPEYTPEEIGAINVDDEMSLADIKAIWDSII